MFKKFVQRILDAQTRDELLEVFYAEDGIDRAFQREKITWTEHQMLLALIEKIDKAGAA